jgi:hypothetical protein
VWRPIDTTQTLVVQGQWDAYGFGLTTITLTANDYRIWPDGYRLERRWDGSTDTPRRLWGDRVIIEYTPVNDQPQRDEITVKLAILATQYDAFSDQKVGDYELQTTNYNEERSRLLSSIGPRHGLEMV